MIKRLFSLDTFCLGGILFIIFSIFAGMMITANVFLQIDMEFTNHSHYIINNMTVTALSLNVMFLFIPSFVLAESIVSSCSNLLPSNTGAPKKHGAGRLTAEENARRSNISLDEYLQYVLVGLILGDAYMRRSSAAANTPGAGYLQTRYYSFRLLESFI